MEDWDGFVVKNYILLGFSSPSVPDHTQQICHKSQVHAYLAAAGSNGKPITIATAAGDPFVVIAKKLIWIQSLILLTAFYGLWGICTTLLLSGLGWKNYMSVPALEIWDSWLERLSRNFTILANFPLLASNVPCWELCVVILPTKIFRHRVSIISTGVYEF